MSKELSLRKLKKLDGYHARLFVVDELADDWCRRMVMKLGSDYVAGKRPYKTEDNTYLTLAFIHKE